MMILSSSLKIAVSLGRQNRNVRRDNCSVILTYFYYLLCLHHTTLIFIFTYLPIYTHTFSILYYLEVFTHSYLFPGFSLYNFDVKYDRNLMKIISMRT